MATRVCLIQGHPDVERTHFGHALAQAYAEGARAAGREVRTVTVAALEFPVLRSQDEWSHGSPPKDIAEAQETIRWADHVVIVFPLWLGAMPALLKAFLEQVMRPGFALPGEGVRIPWSGQLRGRSARLIVTMGMPAAFYRWFYRAHSLKSLERNILRFAGIRPVRSSLIGVIERSDARRRQWLKRVNRLGHSGR